jgi:hypothetical protein
MNRSPLPPTLSRRRLLAGTGALATTGLLSACGGGGDGPAAGTPSIRAFEAERATVSVGEPARLFVRFDGGSGRIEPGLGAVTSGTTIETPPLDASRRYRLIVTGPDGDRVERGLAIAVAWRGRMSNVAPLNVAWHATVATADGGALVIGGSRGETTSSAAIDRFDPASGSFQRLGQLSTGRAGHSAVALGNGQTLIVGGTTAANVAPFAERVNEASGAVQSAGTLQQPRNRHTALRLADGRVLVIGGVNRNSAEIWDPATDRWRLVASRMAHAREHASATLLTNGQVLIVGGDADVPRYVAAELFDPATESFTPLADPPAQPRWLHLALRQSDGSVLVIGGEGPVNGRVEMLASVWRVSADGQRFTPEPALTAARTFAAGVTTPDDDTVLVGGQRVGEAASASVTLRRHAGFTEWAALPGGRVGHTATRLASGRVLVVGGEDADGHLVGSNAVYD